MRSVRVGAAVIATTSIVLSASAPASPIVRRPVAHSTAISKIAYTRSCVLFVVNSDGNDKRRLPSGKGKGGCAASPVWSPDGSRIAFVRNYDDPSGSDREFPGEIYVVRGDGTDLRRLTGRITDVSMPEWSPNGREIAFESRQLPARVKIVGLDGGRPRAVGPTVRWPAEPAWSPSGQIAVVQRVGTVINEPARSSIGAFSPNGSVVRRIVKERRGELGSPTWSPGGSKLAFVAYRCASAGSCRADVRLVGARGGPDERLILLPKSGLDSLAWSPDGRTIAAANGLAGIWTMHLGQEKPVRLTRNEDDAQPVWSPDGSAIAFARLDYNYGGARDAIFLIGSDGRGLRHLVLGHQPSWQPRG